MYSSGSPRHRNVALLLFGFLFAAEITKDTCIHTHIYMVSRLPLPVAQILPFFSDSRCYTLSFTLVTASLHPQLHLYRRADSPVLAQLQHVAN